MWNVFLLPYIGALLPSLVQQPLPPPLLQQTENLLTFTFWHRVLISEDLCDRLVCIAFASLVAGETCENKTERRMIIEAKLLLVLRMRVRKRCGAAVTEKWLSFALCLHYTSCCVVRNTPADQANLEIDKHVQCSFGVWLENECIHSLCNIPGMSFASFFLFNMCVGGI